MDMIRAGDAKAHKNSEVVTAHEYNFGDATLDIARIEIRGRYPDQGRAVNREVKQLCYILEGSGTITVRGGECVLSKGDAVLIQPNEEYFFDGDMVMLVPCTPAWSANQHEYLD